MEQGNQGWAADVPLTIVFTDVEGSTALQAQRGDAHARELIGACEDVVREQVGTHGGRIIKSLGDGLMIAFASPRRAVACALDVNRALAAQAQSGGRVRLRSGVHTGEVMDVEGDLHGAAVSAAARICARAEGGEVLVSEVVRQLCGTVPEVTFTDRGKVSLKGFPDRWRLYRAAAAAQPARAEPGQTAFVGREDIRAELRDLLERATAGRGGVVMIAGEPGVGKSRLAAEVAAEAAQRGLGVYTGHCHQQGDLPYMPWVEMLEAAARGMSQRDLRRRFGEHAAALVQMAPELRRLLPDVPPLPDLPADQQRRYLFNSVRAYLSEIAAERAHVLVLEDLHWADESTLLLLEFVSGWVGDVPLLVLGTHRDAASEVPERLSATLAGFARLPAARLTNLNRLGEDEVGRMLGELAGEPPPPQVAEAIFAESDGNAFFVVEVFRHLVESGRLLDNQGRFRTDLSIEDLDAPANVRLVISQRLARLAEPTRRILGVAAVIGRRFGFRVLQHACHVSSDELLDAIEEAERAQLLVEDERAGEVGYRFGHELMRQTLLSELSTPRRQRHHERVADALEQVHAGELDSHAADIAGHLLAAGEGVDPVRIADHLIRAGDRSQSAAADEEALRSYEQALTLLPDEGGDRQRADVLLKIGLAHRGLRHWDQAIAIWEEAIELLSRLGDVEGAAEWCWELSAQLIWAYRFQEMAQVLKRGLEVLGDHPSPHRARLLGMTGLVLNVSGRHELAAQHISAARALAEREDDPELSAQVTLFETIHHYFLMRLPEVVAAGRRAAGQLRDLGSRWNLADALAFLNVGVTFSGLFDESAAVQGEVEPLATGLGHWAALSSAHRGTFALAVAREADLDGLERLAADQFALATDTGSPGWLAYAHTLRGVVAFWRGDWEVAERECEEGVRLAMPFWHGAHHGFLMLVRAYAGRGEQAVAQLAELEPRLPTPGRDNMLGAWNLAILAAEAMAVAGERERAAALHPLVVEALGTGTLMRQVDGRLIRTTAGITAAAAGLDEEAAGHFEAALNQAEALPHLVERPHARHHYARFLAERGGLGGRERARSLLEEAAAGYAEIGMPRHEAMARAALGQLGGAEGSRAAAGTTKPRV